MGTSHVAVIDSGGGAPRTSRREQHWLPGRPPPRDRARPGRGRRAEWRLGPPCTVYASATRTRRGLATRVGGTARLMGTGTLSTDSPSTDSSLK